MKRRMRAFLAALIMTFGVVTPFVTVQASENIPRISARCAVLMEASSGEILFAHNADERRGMASTTKIMTALVAIEHADLQKPVTVAREAEGVEGSSVYLYAGEQVLMETLLYALMLQSANDAAVAIACDVAGSIEAFVALMNEKAEELGLRNTHFTNPHGLDDRDHYTTARELALIAAAALRNRVFAEIVSTTQKAIPLHDGSATRLLVNHNRLLRTYDDIIGVKTGFTKKCGRTLVSAAQRGDLRLICVTLDDGDDWRDHRALLDYGFSLYERRTLEETGTMCFSVPVCGGEESFVRVGAREAAIVTLKKDTACEITRVVELPRFLYAGVSCGDRIGQIRFFADGKEIAEIPLFAETDVKKMTSRPNFWQKISIFFRIKV